ncbi:MAG: 50S ribosomal protein L18 [Desulfobulbaceae bacterium]|nr:50S ribosomal protein L18 [Desulfobulbaceae bacterium]MCK5322646.1 50S ribosomal protein L18 [Desulfobulbaceae bacterium]MCK5437970.1 50S ribosomal protein L18 [Desulfobulbaceae bacterium]MCK5544232.1 50S ribosomal protein L18 [Desulfobulbaceae bacterium]
MAKTNPKTIARLKRVKRIRKKISGTPERPRLRVFKSSRHIYGQIIDDVAGNTLAAMSTMNSVMKDSDIKGKTAKAHKVGMFLAELAKTKGVTEVIFDRGGYLYHGRIKAFSDGAREGGLVF